MENKIKSVEEVRELLEKKNYDVDKIDEVVNFIKPFYDFYDFMLEEHKMDYNAVEEDSSKFSEEVFTEYLEEMSKSNSPMDFMMQISGEIFKRYAKKYDYSEPESVKIALNKYMEVLMLNEMNKNNGHK
jgi:hypothetical protein